MGRVGLWLALAAMLGFGSIAPGVMPAQTQGSPGFVLCTADGPVPMHDPFAPQDDHGAASCLFAAAHAMNAVALWRAPAPLAPDMFVNAKHVAAPTAVFHSAHYARPHARAPPSGSLSA